jgi:hypothetical protein
LPKKSEIETNGPDRPKQAIRSCRQAEADQAQRQRRRRRRETVMPAADPIIKLVDIRKSYQMGDMTQHVLQGVSLDDLSR